MPFISSNKNSRLYFRLDDNLKRKFEQKFPKYTKRSAVMRELLRMYIDGEVKIVKITETL